MSERALSQPMHPTLDTWRAATDAERHTVAAQIAAALGTGWAATRALCGTERLAEVVHDETGIRFVAVPGGRCTMGIRPDELALARTLELAEGEDTLAWVEQGPAAHEVIVAPFLCARAPVLAAQSERLIGRVPWPVGDEDSSAAAVRFDREATRELMRAVRPYRFRLLTAQEWEWVARSGGRDPFINGSTVEEAEAACKALYASAFDPARTDPGSNGLGIWGLPWGDWVAGEDPWEPGKAHGGAAMLYPWQTDEIIMQLAGMGAGVGNPDENGVRFAVPLPA